MHQTIIDIMCSFAGTLFILSEALQTQTRWNSPSKERVVATFVVVAIKHNHRYYFANIPEN